MLYFSVEYVNVSTDPFFLNRLVPQSIAIAQQDCDNMSHYRSKNVANCHSVPPCNAFDLNTIYDHRQSHIPVASLT